MIYVCANEDASLYKVGTTINVSARLRALARELQQNLTLLAVAKGGTVQEKAIHRLIAEYRVEGEWFRDNAILAAFIQENRVPSVLVTFEKRFDDCRDTFGDKSLARGLLRKAMVAHSDGLDNLSARHSSVFHALKAVNPDWTLRRVQTVWAMAARRIEFREIINLKGIAGVSDDEFLVLVNQTHGTPSTAHDNSAEPDREMSQSLKFMADNCQPHDGAGNGEGGG